MKVEELKDSFERLPITISMDDASLFTEVYGFVGRSGRVFLEGQLLKPRGSRSETLLVFMHPSSSLSLLPLPRALVEAGFHVLCAGSRYLRNDSALIMEKVVLDLGAYVRYAREALGYRKVVLVGWSGGGSLSLYYQAQAERPTVTATPAGDALALARADLLPADGLLLIAAHLSRAETLTEWMDPSVTDELDPEARDPSLDLYGTEVRPPYGAEFVARFRAAQRARNQRITSWCQQQLERMRVEDRGELERGFVVHRTMADPRWLDPSLSPNGRRAGWCYLGDPRTVNAGPVGLARFTTLRSWLSQWSFDASLAKTSLNAPSITVPTLVIENGADDATPADHPRQIFELLGSRDKTYACIPAATHYYQQQPELQSQVVRMCREWLAQRQLLK